MTEQYRERLVTTAALLTPFAAFWWLLPGFSNITLGNDYTQYGVPQQMELLFHVRHGTFPLFIPGFAGGQSIGALTQGQLFHPISWLAACMPGYWRGHAFDWNTLLHIAFLGVANAALYRWLRALRLDRPASFTCAAVAVLNLRTLDLFRYGAALEAYSGQVLLCAALGWVALKPGSWRRHLGVCAATWLLVVSGHPQMMYYGMLGCAFFALIVPFYTVCMRGQAPWSRTQWRQYLGGCAAAAVLGMALSAAYLGIFVTGFLMTGPGRLARSYAWATSFGEPFTGTVANMFDPWRSNIHGAFGGSALLLLPVLAVPWVWTRHRRPPAAILALWSATIIVFLYMQGGRLPVHYVVWRLLPFASSFRVPGRASMVIPLFLTLILAWVLRPRPADADRDRIRPGPSTGRLTMVAAVAYVTGGWALMSWQRTPYSPVTIRDIPLVLELICVLLGGVSLAALGLRARRTGTHGALATWAAPLLTVVHVTVLLQHGIWVTQRRPSPGFTSMREDKRAELTYRHVAGMDLENAAMRRQLQESYPEPRLAVLYTDVLVADSVDSALRMMTETRAPGQTVVVADRLATPDAAPGAGCETGTVVLRHATCNRLQLQVESAATGLLVVNYPHTGHWRARVNGIAAEVLPAHGMYCGIAVPAGSSAVDVRYHSPGAAVGLVLSSAAAAVFAVLICGAGLSRYPRVRPAAAAGAAVTLALVLPLCLVRSSHRGRNLGTEYRWSETPAGSANLAHGRDTEMSPPRAWSDWFRQCSGRAVDGHIGTATAAYTAAVDQPTWAVDLGHMTEVGEIRIHEADRPAPVNLRPLQVGVSVDDRSWRVLADITEPQRGSTPLVVTLDPPVQARYVFVRSLHHGSLALAEVSVHPAGN